MRFASSICILSLLLCGFARSQQHAGEQSPAEQAQGAPEVAPLACKYDVKTAEFAGPNAQYCRAFCYVDKELSADGLTAIRSLAPFRSAQLIADTLDKALESFKSNSEASRKLKNDLIAKLEGYQKRQSFLEKEIKKNEELIAQHQGDLKSLKDLSKTPKYNNPLNPRGSLDDENLKNYRLHLAMQSKFATQNRAYKQEVDALKNELFLFKNFLISIDPNNSSSGIVDSLRQLEMNVEHLTKPGETKFLKLNGKSISLSRQTATTEIDRVDFKNPETGRYDLACDYLGTNIVDAEKVVVDREPCDLTKVWNQISLKSEVTVADQNEKDEISFKARYYLDKPQDEASKRSALKRESALSEAADQIAKEKAKVRSEVYESRYLAELKKGKRPEFIEIYKDRSDYAQFVSNPKNWPEMAKKGRQLYEIKAADEIREDLEERFQKGEKIPELEIAMDKVYDADIAKLLETDNLRYQKGLANRERLERLLKAAEQPGPMKIRLEDHKILFPEFWFSEVAETTSRPILSYSYDPNISRLKIYPVVEVSDSVGTFQNRIAVHLYIFNFSKEENETLAKWPNPMGIAGIEFSSLPLSEARKAGLCKALKSAL